MIDNEVRLSDPHRRDLELVLLGAAISKEFRERATKSFAEGEISREVETLLTALAAGDKGPVLAWFDARGAVAQKGKDLVDATIERLRDEARRVRVSRIVGELQHARKIMSTSELRAKLQECLAAIERD